MSSGAPGLEGLSPRLLYRRLLGGSAIYTTGALLQQGTSFLLLPVYLRFLTPADLGVVALAELLAAVLAGGLGLAAHASITRFFFEWRSEGVAEATTGKLWLLSSAFAAMAGALILLAGEPVLRILLRQLAFEPYVPLVIGTSVLNAISQGPMALLRIREEAWAFVAISYSSSLATLGSVVYFVVFAEHGARGVLEGALAGAALAATLGTFAMLRRVRFTGPAHLREALRFAVPLVPATLIDSAAGGADRFLLDKFVPLSQVGLYGVASKIANAGVRLLGYTSFKTAWIPFAVRLNSERADGRERMAAMAPAIVGVGLVLAVVTVAFSREALILLGREAFLPAASLVPLLVLANLALIFDHLAGVGFLMSRKTQYAPLIVATQLIVMLGLGLVLIPSFGAAGAGVGAAVAAASMVGFKMHIAQRHYPVPYPWKILATLTGSALLIIFLGWLTSGTVGQGMILDVLLKTAVIALFGVLVVRAARERGGSDSVFAANASRAGGF